MRLYVLWLLTAAMLLATAIRAAHVREVSSSSLAGNYANDPRPDVVNEQTSDILGTGGEYAFRLPQPQINKQQQQHPQQQDQHQHKTKQPNTTATYVTTTKPTSSSSSSSSSSGSTADGAGKQSSTKWSTTRPASSTTATSANNKAGSVTYPATTPAESTQHSGFVYNVSVTAQQPTYNTSTTDVANDEAAITANAENDGESSKKIISSSVVTSVSVILNGNEPEFTDALGHKVPKPQPSLQVASPIDLLNPDRYEFYTFDENGELVKRLMTMEEIQSIVANGDGENSSIIQHVPIDASEPEKNVQDIVDSVQNVLNKEVESNKNISKDALPVLDTPDVTSSWSMILPAIFGNGGGGSDIFTQQKPQQIVMTPDSELLETSTNSKPSMYVTKHPKPNKRKPGQKRKPTTPAPTTTSTAVTPQVVQEELGPHESVYTGIQQYQSVAANMQNFDGFSQLQMQPIYHKLPENTHTQVDTTTRRVFVNNKEIIQSGTTVRTTQAEENGDELNAGHGKRPPVVVYKRPVGPHRHKTPNGGDGSSTTKKPQWAQNKQKIKKKPTTTTKPEPITTSTETTLAIPELTTPTSTTKTTTTPATTTTTPAHTTTTPAHTTTTPTHTTTTPAPTTTTPAPTTTTPVPTTTTPKPTTTTPEPTTTTPAPIVTTPEPIVTTPEPIVTTPEPIVTTPEPIITTTTLKPSSTTPKKKRKKPTRQPGQGNKKPHPVGEKRKPPTGKPRPTGAAQHNAHKHQQAGEGHGNKYQPAANVAKPSTTPIEPTTNKRNTTVGHKPNRTRPRPHKKPAHTTISTATTTPTTPEPATTTTATTTTPVPITTTTIIINPVPSVTTTTENTLVVEHFPGYHPIHVKPSHANKRPGVSGYPLPHYKPAEHAVHETVVESDAPDLGQLKRKPLPSLAQIQQQHKKPAQTSLVLDDRDTLSSFDQILESLKEELSNKAGTDLNESSASEVRPVTDIPLKIDLIKEPSLEASPISASVDSTTVAQFDTIDWYGNIDQKENTNLAVESLSMEKEDESTIEDATTHLTTVATIQPSTKTEETKINTTTQPIQGDTTEQQVEQVLSDTTNTSEYSLEEKEQNESETAKVEALETKDSDKNGEDLSHVVKFEPLYADVQEPIITEITTASTNDDDDTTVVDVIDEVNGQAVYGGTTPTADSNTEYQTPTIVRLPVTQKIETMIAEDSSSTEPAPQVADLKPHLNMDVLKPTDQINMSEFQTQAATVASTLVDGTNSLAADVLMSSNGTRNEIDFLMSDVIHQMTLHQSDVDRPDPIANGNRLTNFAQLNSSFLLKPTQSDVQQSIKESSLPAYGVLSTASSNTITSPANDSVEVLSEEPLLVPTTELVSETEYEFPTKIGTTTEALAYTSHGEQKTDKIPDSTEKLEKEHKAELSMENAFKNEIGNKTVIHQGNAEGEEGILNFQAQHSSAEKGEVEHTIEIQPNSLEKVVVQQNADVQSDSVKQDKVKQKLPVKLDAPGKGVVLETTPEELEYETTTVRAQIPFSSQNYATQQQDMEDQEASYEAEKETYFSQTEETQMQESDGSSEPLTESETILQEERWSAEETNEEKKDTEVEKDLNVEMEKISGNNDDKEKIAQLEGEQDEEKKETEAEKDLNVEMEKISGNNDDKEKIAQSKGEQEELATPMDELDTQTDKNLTNDILQTISIKETEDQSRLHAPNVSDSKIEKVNKLEIPALQSTEVLKETKDTKTSHSKEEVKKHEEQQTENIEEYASELNKNEAKEAFILASDKDISEKEIYEKESNEKEINENITNETTTESEDMKENYTNQKVTMEKESNDAISTVLTDMTTEETHDFITKSDATDPIDNSTEKDINSVEDDNVTNAANLKLQYTDASKVTEKYQFNEEQEQSSKTFETEVTTAIPTDESSTIVYENDGVKPESATDVTIMTSEEIDITESDEDAYIKLGESTTKYTAELSKGDLSFNNLAAEEDIASTEDAYVEVTTPTLAQPIQQDISEATTQYGKQSEEDSEEEAQPPKSAETILPKVVEVPPQKVAVTTNALANDASKLDASKLSNVTEQPPLKQTDNPILTFDTQQLPQIAQLSTDYRPDQYNQSDVGNQPSDTIPKFPTSPVLAAMSTPVEKSPSTTYANSITTTIPITSTTTTPKPAATTTKRIHTLKPVSYYNKQSGINAPKPAEATKILPYSANTPQQRPMLRPAQLNNLMATSTQATRPPVKMEPSPTNSKGLEASVINLDEDLQSFVKLCNELAFSYWKSITSEKISSARSLIVSPFALTSMLSMVFLGARGSTSGEMNEVLKLDDMVTFNPHLVFRNITDSVERATDSDIATTAFVREIFSDRANGKILQFFKEKTQQFYSGHVEEVNFHVVNDVIRRRTNLLVKRHTMGKVLEYLRTNSLWVNGPLATISANLFQTDCRRGSTQLTDGEMFFQVHPSVRQRRLIPIPAVLYKSGFTAGYDPNLDATIVAFGSIQDTVSLVYVMPGHQSTLSPAESLERLERELVEQAFSKNAWSNILTSLMDRPGMEVQLPRFSHRSFVNASLGLQKMGLKGLFKSDFADLRGLTGSSNRDIYLSDVIQINTFSTCGEEKIAEHHHVEMYPAPPLRKRNKDLGTNDDGVYDSSEAVIDFGSLVHDSALGRGFYDDLLDPKYLEMPLSLRPRQARVPDAPRLRFDKPFLYFVRHNPTGIILFMGRFNPRLLP